MPSFRMSSRRIILTPSILRVLAHIIILLVHVAGIMVYEYYTVCTYTIKRLHAQPLSSRYFQGLSNVGSIYSRLFGRSERGKQTHAFVLCMYYGENREGIVFSRTPDCSRVVVTFKLREWEKVKRKSQVPIRSHTCE